MEKYHTKIKIYNIILQQKVIYSLLPIPSDIRHVLLYIYIYE